MIPILFARDSTEFTSNGLGRLTDATKCLVEEERNGIYELEMQYPINGQHFAEIEVGAIVCARHSDAEDAQPFRIYKITRPLNGVITIYGRHLSYDLNKITVAPFTEPSITQLFANLPTHAVNNCPFTFETDKTVANSYTVSVPSSIRSLLGGSEGSILDVYGTGEYEFNNYNVKLWLNRGTDSGVTIRYAKNLTELKQESEDTDSVTSVLPYWAGTDEEGNETSVVASSSVDSGVGYAETYTNEWYTEYTDGTEAYEGVISPSLCIPLDLSEEFEDAPTEEQLIAAAEAWLETHATVTPKVNLTISFVQLWQTNEYANYAPLQRVGLCDTVTVLYPALGVSAKTKVIRTKYDCLLERYTEMELGEPRSSLAQTILRTEDKVAKVEQTAITESMMGAAIRQATELITGGYGGHVVISKNADGEPEEILIMNTDNIATAQYIIRMNLGGIGFSSDFGQTYSTAWTIDGRFVADFITAGTLRSIMIAAPDIDGQTLTFWDLATGVFQNYGVSTVTAQVETSEGTYTPTSYTVKHKTRIADGQLTVDASANGGTETPYMSLGISAEGMNYEFYEGIAGSDQSASYPYAGLNLYGDKVTGLGGVHYQYDGTEITYNPSAQLTPDYLVLGGAENVSRDGYYPNRNQLRLQSGWGNYRDAIVFENYYGYEETPSGTRIQFHDPYKRRVAWDYTLDDQLFIDSTVVNRIVCVGYLTDSRTTVWAQIPLCRPISPDVKFLDIYAEIKARVSTSSGYIIGGSGSTASLAYEDATYTYEAFWSDCGISLKIRKPNGGAIASGNNNYPLAIDFIDLGINFYATNPYA